MHRWRGEALFFVPLTPFVGVPSVIKQGALSPKADGNGIVDVFSNTPTAFFSAAVFSINNVIFFT